MNKLDIINKFFDSYSKHDLMGIKNVMAEDITWYFLGQHKFAGVKNGIDEVLAFFDTMGTIMTKSSPVIDKLIVSENDNYLIECQRIKINRDDGINIDHHVCVLWRFENGKIKSGRHFFADPEAADKYFNAVASMKP